MKGLSIFLATSLLTRPGNLHCLAVFFLKMKLNIDPQLKALIPPLGPDEKAQLEANILAEGIRDPLVIATYPDEDGQEIRVLADGHNRYDIAERHGLKFSLVERDFDSFGDVKIWMIDNQQGRRNLTDGWKFELAQVKAQALREKGINKMREMGATGGRGNIKEKGLSINDKPFMAPIPHNTREEIAKDLGWSTGKVAMADVVWKQAAPEVKEQVLAGEKTISGAYKEIKKGEKQTEKEAKRIEKQELKKPKATGTWELIQSPIATAELEPESLDFIITDPPYPYEFMPVYSDLATFALRHLKPGGSLIAMVGQSYLPEIMQRLSIEGLNYHWMLSYLTPGGQATQLWQRKVNTFWKPLLWFVKGKYEGDWIGDVTKSDVNDNDKQHHYWGQSESGMADIINRFTYPEQVICDPFCGGGTTGVVAVQLGRKFIGLDSDTNAIRTSNERLSKI